MNKQLIKKEASALIDELPEETSWDALMHKIYIRQKIENGLKDIHEGKVYTTEEIEQKFTINK